jgi:hypothetical protein
MDVLNGRGMVRLLTAGGVEADEGMRAIFKSRRDMVSTWVSGRRARLDSVVSGYRRWPLWRVGFVCTWAECMEGDDGCIDPNEP